MCWILLNLSPNPYNMNLSYKELLPKNFSDHSRVWIYQSSRLFTLQEALSIEEMINQFVAKWTTHGTPVKGFGTLFFGHFVVLMADEELTGVSGCSTDSSVRLIKHIELTFNVNMFERTNLAFIIEGKIQLLPLSQLAYALDKCFIKPTSLMFDNNVSTKKELEERWIIALAQSWLASRYNIQMVS